MNKIYLFPVDSTLKTFSVIDSGVGVKYELSLEQGKTTVLATGDILLGFVSQGIDEFRYSFIVASNNSGVLELEKEIERAKGVQARQFLPGISSSISLLLAGEGLVDVDQSAGRRIHDMLLCQSTDETRVEVPFVSQRITYGAPGTGKSRQTKDETAAWEAKGNVFRTTFHPDSDYSTFVGAYKPVMGEEAGLTEVWKLTKDGEVQEAVHKKKKGITYRFVAQEFIKAYVRAWVKMAEATKDADGKLKPEPVYLVIEEINRGNCAQIFGDIFQLLDRENDTGYSEYPIDADEELSKYLGSVFAALVKDDEGKAKIPAKVLSGEQMMLPPNMLLRATMNTSDQSLFPIDSAFKRRWDWEYVPILEGKDKNTKTPLGWKIVVGADAAKKEYDWWSFVGKINDVIDELTSSEDKKLGYFFVKPKDKTIDQKLLVNKVFFYLWNDVFKDMVGDPALQVQINGKGHDLKFHDFFKKDDGAINVDMIKAFMDKLKVESPAGNQQGGTTPQTTETTVTE